MAAMTRLGWSARAKQDKQPHFPSPLFLKLTTLSEKAQASTLENSPIGRKCFALDSLLALADSKI